MGTAGRAGALGAVRALHYRCRQRRAPHPTRPRCRPVSVPLPASRARLKQCAFSSSSHGASGPQSTVRLFTLSQLVAPSVGAQPHGSYREGWVPLQQQTANLIAQLTSPRGPVASGSDDLERQVTSQLVQRRQITLPAIERMKAESGKRLIDFTVGDFRQFSPMIVGIRDPFSLTVNELFLTYYNRRLQNKFHQFLASRRASCHLMSY